CIVLEFFRIDDAVKVAPALALLRRHDASGIKQLRRAPVTDDARQQGTGAHVAAGKTDAGEQERGFGLRCPEAEIAEQRYHRACTDTDAIDGTDNRLRARAHGFYELTGHPRKLEKSIHISAQQRPNDVVDIAAGAEIAAVRAEYDDLDVARAR